MPSFDAPTDAPEFELLPADRYVLRLKALEDAEDRGYGDAVRWKFDALHPTTLDPIVDKDGEPVELWQISSTKMSPKAKARIFMEALLGRQLDVDGREIPDVRSLVGRCMKTLLIHEKRADGKGDKATLTMIEPFSAPSAAAVAAPGPAAAADRTTLLAELRSSIRKCEVLGTPKHLNWLGMNIDALDDDELGAVLSAVRQDILDS